MGIYLRGQVWWMCFTVNGRHYQESTETQNRKMAQRIFDKVKYEISERKWFGKLPGEDKTFKEMMERYLDDHASGLKSYKSFQAHVKNLNSFFGDFRLTEINRDIVKEYKKKRLEDGMKVNSVIREMATMGKAFNLAVDDWQWLKENPMGKISFRGLEKGKRERVLSYDEERRLIENSPKWMAEIITLALHTGMRRGEILSLVPAEVDLNKKLISLPKYKTKNGKPRDIPLDETALNLLKEKLSNSVNLVFGRKGRVIPESSFEFVFDRSLKRAGISDLHFHDLRHSFTTRLFEAKQDPYKIGKILGHSSLKMTEKYEHMGPEYLRETVLALDQPVSKLLQ
jgi:integrase